MKLTKEQIDKLNAKLPDWAVKPHPTKEKMSAIHPMSIIERLNDVFEVGGWNFETEFIKCEPFVQKTKNGPRNMFMSAVKGRMTIGDLTIEQFGGSSNDDMGDALKGGATDALTKIASYLNIGAEIYKGRGNADVQAPLSDEEVQAAKDNLLLATDKAELKEIWMGLDERTRRNEQVVEYSKKVAAKLK